MSFIKKLKIFHFSEFDKNFFWLFVSSGALIGFLPLCPGTFGALEGLIIFWFLKNLSLFAQLIIILLISILGVISSHFASKILGNKDPDIVVIDEIAGMWVSLLGKVTILEYFLAFVLFRIIDISKPFPLKKLEKLSGGWGIMVDDLLAGVFTNILVTILSYLVKTHGLI